MNTITHALAPVLICRCWVAGKMPLKPRDYGLIGLAGALPDLLNPHLSLDARLTSWSHGVPFWMLLSAFILILSRIKRLQLGGRLAVIFSLGYLLHMICDGISGGINWLYPWRDFVWGAYWVTPPYWIPLDVFCLLSAYFLFRLKPLMEKARQAKQRSQRNQAGLTKGQG